MKTKVKNQLKHIISAGIGSGHSIYWNAKETKKLTDKELESPRVQRLIKMGHLKIDVDAPAPLSESTRVPIEKPKEPRVKSKGGDT